jgi:hypothetical protein
MTMLPLARHLLRSLAASSSKPARPAACPRHQPVRTSPPMDPVRQPPSDISPSPQADASCSDSASPPPVDTPVASRASPCSPRTVARSQRRWWLDLNDGGGSISTTVVA